MAKKKEALTPEERLQVALVPESEQPYKLPKNWCWVKFGTVCKFENGYAFKSERFTKNQGIPVVRISNIVDNSIDLDDCVYTTEIDIDSKYIIHNGDLLIAMSGATTGKNGIYASDKIAYLNQRVGNIKVIDQRVLDPFFRDFYISSAEQQILNSAYGGAQPNISSSKICDMSFPLPPLPEQQRIVERIESLFSKLDEAKQKVQDALDSFETRKAAILHKAFTGELTAQWRKEHGVEMDSWEKTILKNVCKVNPKKIDTSGLPDNLKVSFFPMAALSEVSGEITDPQIRLLKDVKSGFTNFLEGDVVFAKITPCMENGKSAVIGKLVNGIGYGTTEFYVLRCGKDLYNRYLYHMIRDTTFRSEAKSVMSGAVGQQRVPKSFMENYPLKLPSVPEQVEIVRTLDNLLAKEQQAKETAEDVLEQIDLIKKAILARAFRGKLGTNNPSEESALSLLKKIIFSAPPKRTISRNKQTTEAQIPAGIQKRLATSVQEKVYRYVLDNPHCTVEQVTAIGKKVLEVVQALRELEEKSLIIRNPKDDTLTAEV